MRHQQTFCLGVAIAICASLLVGCSTVNTMLGGNTAELAKKQAQWFHAPAAISVAVTADSALNLYETQPHTLMLAVVQMADDEAFGTLVEDEQALRDWLASPTPAPGFLRINRYVVLPGMRAILDVDRVQNARYVGLVAGYYGLDRATATRVFPLVLNARRHGWFVKTWTAAPAPLRVELLLGTQTIVSAQAVSPQLFDRLRATMRADAPVSAAPLRVSPGDAEGVPR